MFILVGSEAAATHGIKLRRGAIKDVDFFSTEEHYSRETLQDTYPNRDIEVFFHPELANYDWSGTTASVNELYTIKISHSYWIHREGKAWRKHVRDAAFLKRAGGNLIPELHTLLYRIWEQRFGKKPANLEQSPEDFFNSSVKRIYEHDSIHAAVAYFDGVPLFNRILRDGHEVAVDKAKFDNLPYDIKLKLVREEVYATALERKLIPSDFTVEAKEAYDYALTKTITSFTKGWFPLFILDNYEELREPADDFIATFYRNKDRLIALPLE